MGRIPRTKQEKNEMEKTLKDEIEFILMVFQYEYN